MEIQVGDRVKVINKKLSFYGKTGTVKQVFDNTVDVQMDSYGVLFCSMHEIEKIIAVEWSVS